MKLVEVALSWRHH